MQLTGHGLLDGYVRNKECLCGEIHVSRAAGVYGRKLSKEMAPAVSGL